MTGGELSTDIEAELLSLRKQVADANAERIRLESALVDAMGCLQFYAAVRNHQMVPGRTVAGDGGARARVTLNRLFDRAAEVARVQALKPVAPADGLGGCDTCEEP